MIKEEARVDDMYSSSNFNADVSGKSTKNQINKYQHGQKKCLKNQIKDTNAEFIQTLEESFKDAPSKYGVILAKEYANGKRVGKNLKRAFDILTSVTTTEAKFLLLKISYENGKYAD